MRVIARTAGLQVLYIRRAASNLVNRRPTRAIGTASYANFAGGESIPFSKIPNVAGRWPNDIPLALESDTKLHKTKH